MKKLSLPLLVLLFLLPIFAGNSFAEKATPQISTSQEIATVKLNSATIEQLSTLPGIGPATAKSIIAYREQNGPFSSVDQLTEVKGIGPKKLAKLAPYLKL